MKVKVLFSLVLAALVSSYGLAANTIEVTAGAAINGNYGLQVFVDGSDSTPSYVETDTPALETGIKMSFMLNPNGLDIAPPPAHLRIAKALSSFPKPPTASSVEHLVVILKRNDLDTQYHMRVMAEQNYGFYATIANFYLINDGGPAKLIEIEWVQGQGPQGAQDGRCSVFVDGVLKGERTNLNTSEFNVDKFRAGVFQIASDPAATGSYALDDFVLTRIP